ncbi:MAG: chemotaxis-specific protein-glutamate methyltransferase CheB [Campylobacterota bacterium]|nr:chemotaxis-specific protein-glutamate methyltransferase CheB [Campylobacterota bacterium]
MAKSILIVDDSALIRKQLGSVLDKEGYDIGFAKNGEEALDFVNNFDFDLITMDINMPVMDGLTAVKHIMKIKPTPILMVSSLTSSDADITFECLDAGAIDVILKPGTITLKLEESEDEIKTKVRESLTIPRNNLMIRKKANRKKAQLNTISSDLELVPKSDKVERLVLIGSSTGGPGLIEDIVKSLPSNYPYPVIVVQHMPDNFTNGFAKRLNNYTDLEVIESKNAATIYNGQVIIAYGGQHLTIGKKASGVLTTRHKSKNDRFFTPSVDELFLSADKAIDPKNILAIELTGIGNDGAEGMLKLRKDGAYTLAEDETTSVVYGMPKSCWENGGAIKKMPFPNILQEILDYPNKDI